MSGIVGIVHRDKSPCDRHLIERLTEFLYFRGPDAHHTWVNGPVGFGHALLRTTPESIDEHQPCTLDDRVWITAEARLDDPEGLRRRLAEHGAVIAESVSDAHLILAAYAVWNEESLQYLQGDFAFAIWDQVKRRLFCARDHFGVRPFFYGELGRELVFSNTLACLRLHPYASRELDEHFMGDWLLVNHCRDPERTAFTNLRRLPAAHFLTLDAGGLRVRRYWTLPTEHSIIRFKQDQDYVEEFRRLLRLAIRDRVRTPRAAVFMSGGLDSATLAGVAHKSLQERFGSSELRAYAHVFERLIKDPESTWAPLAAVGIGIPLQVTAMDDYVPFPDWDPTESSFSSSGKPAAMRSGWQPEPANYPLLEAFCDCHRQAAAHARVALTGFGPDVSLAWPVSYFIDLFRRGQFIRLSNEIATYWRHYGRHPPLGLRWLVTQSWRRQPPWTCYPEWLNESFVARLDLRNRYRAIVEEAPAAHGTRSLAYRNLTDIGWTLQFESRDAGVTGVPLSVHHPYFDMRLIKYCLSIPPLPWCICKEILRQAAIGAVPEAVRLRPKTLFPMDASVAVFRQLDSATLARYTLPEALDRFVSRKKVRALEELLGPRGNGEAWVDYRPYGFAYWMQQQKGPFSLISSEG